MVGRKKKVKKKIRNEGHKPALQCHTVTFNQGVLTVHDHSEQTVKERLEALVPTADDFMENLNRPVKIQEKREF